MCAVKFVIKVPCVTKTRLLLAVLLCNAWCLLQALQALQGSTPLAYSPHALQDLQCE
jgi:hypothetical protein